MANERTFGLRLRAIDKISSTLDRVKKKFPELARGVNQAATNVKLFNQQTRQTREILNTVGGKLKSVGNAMTKFITLPVTAAGAAGVKFFIDFEQGLKGVEKTTGLTGKELEKFGKNLDRLSTEIPVGTDELLELAQAGGQLGVQGADNLEKFATTMAMLSRASNVAGEEGAQSVVRILNVTGTAVSEVDRFASTLVRLGNNFAATESEILNATTEIARGIAQFGGVTSAQTLAIGTALQSLGVNAEAGGTVVTDAFIEIDKAIRKGGTEMKVLERLTGLTGEALKKEFQQNAVGVFEKFIGGIQKVQEGGGNTIQVLDFLGMSGARVAKVIPVLAQRSETLSKALVMANEAFSENTALNKEFLVQTETLGSELSKLKNTFMSLLRVIGEMLAPTVMMLSKMFRGIFNFLRNNPTLTTFIAVLAGLLAVLGPILVALGGFLLILPALQAGAVALGTALLPLTLKILAIAAVIGLVIGLAVILIKKWDGIKDFFANLWDDLGDIFERGVQRLSELVKFLPLNTIGLLLRGASSLASMVGFGGERGAKNGNKGLAANGRQEVGGAIDVNFRNAPEGTTARGRSEGPVGLNLGFAGGIQ